MGFVYDTNSRYSWKCAENLFPSFLAWAQVCILAGTYQFPCVHTNLKVSDSSHAQAYRVRTL